MTDSSALFPSDFKWGVATSAYQIEGATKEGGRGASIWDSFARKPGRIKNGATADQACDHYNRYQEDVQIMKQLGIKDYRLSVAWPRIFPQGKGDPKQEGLDFYDRLIDELLENDITPNVTLYHWDLPLALESQRGWLNRDTAKYFAEYAACVVNKYKDRVKYWTTINEPWVICNYGYATGEMAPGYQDEFKSIKASHHVLLAHGMAVKEMRKLKKDLKIGIAQFLCPCYPSSDSKEDVEAAKMHWVSNYAWFMDPVFKQAYPKADSFRLDCVDSVVEDGDLKLIGQPIDFLGVNYYYRNLVNELGIVKQVNPQDQTDMNWEIFPQGLYDLLKQINEDYKLPPVYITENGAAFEDKVTEEGQFHDTRRIDFIRKHLIQLEKAIADGVDVRGYYLWSLLDNFEWAYGYTQRFGLVHVDYETQKRTIKDSGLWYGQVANNNKVVEADNLLVAASSSSSAASE